MGVSTFLSIDYSNNNFSVIEEPFNEFDINSETEKIALSLTHYLKKSYNLELYFSISGENRKSKSFLLGNPFSFSPGSVNGESEVTVLRLSQGWTKKSLEQVFAVRSSLNFGVNLFDPTMKAGTTRDSKYFSWLGQFQYVRRLNYKKLPLQLLLRANIQWTDDQLLSLEQFSIGGFTTVRSYRENTLVRDRAFTSSAELRIPLKFNKRGKETIQLASFIDFGKASNNGSVDDRIESISSAGLGVLFNFDHVTAQLYWGQQLRDIDYNDNDLQDQGFHFQMIFNFL